MKRIHNAAMLAAMLAFSGSSQAGTGTRSRCSLEEQITVSRQPNTTKMVDPDDHLKGLDYLQESRLNDRQRELKRQKSRHFKEQYRSLT